MALSLMGSIVIKLIVAVLMLFVLLALIVAILFYFRGRMNKKAKPYSNISQRFDNGKGKKEAEHGIKEVWLTSKEKIVSLENGLLAVRYDGDSQFESFLEQGASSDKELIYFLTKLLKKKKGDLNIQTKGFGCSTIAVAGRKGERYFGRNFDWYPCTALIVEMHPINGYASLSTVNTDFIHIGTRLKSLFMREDMLIKAAIYLPLDGMNEKGLCVSVNMIQDSATIHQDRGFTDITTTTAVRLLLDRAANVREAVDILSRYDMHASLNFMIHFAICDALGASVAVEYIDNKMVVTDTPVLTNFYLEKGKYGIGTSQSMIRYRVLMETLKQFQVMTAGQVRDALNSVSKHNYHDRETTEWSIVFDQSAKTATYYHQEKYQVGYKVSLERTENSVR